MLAAAGLFESEGAGSWLHCLSDPTATAAAVGGVAAGWVACGAAACVGALATDAVGATVGPAGAHAALTSTAAQSAKAKASSLSQARERNWFIDLSL